MSGSPWDCGRRLCEGVSPMPWLANIFTKASISCRRKDPLGHLVREENCDENS